MLISILTLSCNQCLEIPSTTLYWQPTQPLIYFDLRQYFFLCDFVKILQLFFEHFYSTFQHVSLICTHYHFFKSLPEYVLSALSEVLFKLINNSLFLMPANQNFKIPPWKIKHVYTFFLQIAYEPLSCLYKTELLNLVDVLKKSKKSKKLLDLL